MPDELNFSNLGPEEKVMLDISKKQQAKRVQQLKARNLSSGISSSALASGARQTDIGPSYELPSTLNYGYNEMSFLYDSSLAPTIGIDNDDNQDSIYHTVDTSKLTVVYKHSSVKNTAGIKNYLANTTERPYNNDANPYSKLLADFNQSAYRAMRIKAADLVYLRNLGVYPINRMWILRRYAEGVVVPNNLNTWSLGNCPRPISTMVGWIKEDGTDNKIFDFSFNEGWTTQTKMIHEVFLEILSNEFGGLIGTGAKLLMPSANWSQGLLFGFLEQMGLTEYTWDNIPIGDPNVLQEAPIRKGGGGGDQWEYTLESKISFDLETEYEQKLIGDVDPGSAMLDILQNAIKMGTSNVKYIFKPGSELVNSLLKANQSSGKDMAEQWLIFIKVFIIRLTSAITELVGKMEGKFSGAFLNNVEDKNSLTPKTLGKNLVGDILNTILASTVRKYHWPIQGSIGLMTGINTTPWHLTIGNPYSPILSMANIVVDSINVSDRGELAYNDMPRHIKFNITCHVGRNLGGQEIMQMFNNSYFRTYLKDYRKENTKGDPSGTDVVGSTKGGGDKAETITTGSATNKK